ncbi:MAG: hypothetical protein P0S95_01620 [Rhabdochlamydiaceae bacterium]|nr:hypothetical protein [Candidatus Amphrikana amoebophyrae]
MSVSPSSVVSVKGYYCGDTPRLHLHRFAQGKIDGKLQLVKRCFCCWGYRVQDPGTHKYYTVGKSKMIAQLAHSVDYVKINTFNSKLSQPEKIALMKFTSFFANLYSEEKEERSMALFTEEATQEEYTAIVKYIGYFKVEYATRIFFSEVFSKEFIFFLNTLSLKCNAKNRAKLKTIQAVFERKKLRVTSIVAKAEALLARIGERSDFVRPTRVIISIDDRGDVKTTIG